MTDAAEKNERRINPLLDDEIFQIAAEPAKPGPESAKSGAEPAKSGAEPYNSGVETGKYGVGTGQERIVPDFVKRHIQAAQEKRVSAAEEPPQPPRRPMLSGVFTFPFQLNALSPLMFISLGLMVFGWLLMFWLEYGAIMGATSAYYLGMPTLAAGMLAFGYAAACSFSIIEETSNGWNTFEIAPDTEWKEWIWSFLHIGALLAEAGIIGYALRLVCTTDSWLPMIAGTLAVFPPVLLGALAADGAWVPLAMGKILQSFFLVAWAWGLFYLETIPLAVGWTMLVKTGLAGQGPWLTPLYAGPLLAVIILICARLIGRLAGCIAKATIHLNEGVDDDEDF
jgi:hypothetical protein